MTCGAGTYRYMAPEVFSKDPLPKGAKKWYDHKADVFSFAIVLWALIKCQTPFKGRSELIAAYATAQSMRPSVDEFPKDLLSLLQSCWAEDPKLRPEFAEITQFLTKLLHKCRTEGTTPNCKIETKDPHRIQEEEEFLTPHAHALIPESVEDSSKQKRETQSQNSNGYTEGQSHSISQTPAPCFVAQSKSKKNMGKCMSPCLAKSKSNKSMGRNWKSSWFFLRRCFAVIKSN